MSGDSASPYVEGTDPYLVNFVQVGDFAEKGERSWHIRYARELASWALLGRTFMTRYIKGTDAPVLATDSGRERQLDIELQYRVQSGPLKALDICLRIVAYRSDFSRNTTTRGRSSATPFPSCNSDNLNGIPGKSQYR